MPKRWLVKRRSLVALEATTYSRICGQQQLGKCLHVAGSQQTQKKFCCKNYIHVKYFHPFFLYENIFTTK